MIIVGGSLENAVYFLIICYTDSFEDNGDSRRKTKDLSLGIVTSQWCRGKELACQCWRARDRDLIPGSGRSPEVGNEYLLQYSCLENVMDRGAWRATVCRVAESGRTEHAHTLLLQRLVQSHVVSGQVDFQRFIFICRRIMCEKKPHSFLS